MQLLVGLGNPGSRYERTRHNVGFDAINRIAEDWHIGPFRNRFQALAAEGRVEGHRVLLLKPQTYMNLSGESASAAVKFYRMDSEAVTVFHDEMELAAGKVRIRVKGGVAGHRGLISLRQHLGDDFRRVRIGVGHPGNRDRVVGHVLGKASEEDQARLLAVLKEISASLPLLLEGDSDRFASRVGEAAGPAAQDESSKDRSAA